MGNTGSLPTALPRSWHPVEVPQGSVDD